MVLQGKLIINLMQSHSPNTLQFKERRYDTPLFKHALKATALLAQKWEHSAQYLVLDSDRALPADIFQNSPSICPAYVHKGRTFMFLEGDCLSEYFKAKMRSNLVLNEQQIWHLLSQVVEALLALKKHGIIHPHLKQYSIRRIDSSKFRLIYHPDMLAAAALTKKNFGWYHFYFSPEELLGQPPTDKSIVFSLGALLLNIMNPLDFQRSIYSLREFKINKITMNEKMHNAGLLYSSELISTVSYCLIEDQNSRVGLEQLREEVQNSKRNEKKSKFVEHLQSSRKGKRKLQISSNFDRSGKTKCQELQNQPPLISEFCHGPSKKHYPLPSPSTNLETSRAESEFKFDRGTFGGKECGSTDSPIIEMDELAIAPTTNEPTYEPDTAAFPFNVQNCLLPLEEIIRKIGRQGTWIEGDIYYGDFLHGRRQGFGLEVFPEKEYYLGHFAEDLFHGDGFYYWNAREYFLGTFSEGVKVAGVLQGRLTYEGEFKGNLRHGYGKCSYQSGAIYEGNWRDGKRNGQGTLIQITGDKFVGQFKQGKKQGKGSFITSECTYQGYWQDDQLIGEIDIIYANNDHFKGKVDNQLRKCGEGVFKFANGTKLIGEFQEDDFVKGEILYKDGGQYIGEVKRMQRHGFGKYTYSNGEVFSGRWERGKKVEGD